MTEPHIDYYDHPMFRPIKSYLTVPSEKTLLNEIHRWLWTGGTGGLITGPSREGKTTAIRSLMHQLYTRGKKAIPVYYVSIPDRDKKTIMSIFRLLCLSANKPVRTTDRNDHLSGRYIEYLTDRAVETKCQYAVLIVDEMQRLRPSQFNAFAEVYDALRIRDICLTVIFIGNDQETTTLLEDISGPKFSHIRGRFFTSQLIFHGLTSKDEVRKCLMQYDTLVYPENGPCYTAYFLREAFEDGWRFSELSSILWRIFREYQTKYKISSWGIQYFEATANTLLTDFLPQYGVDAVNDDMIHECIRVSGLIPSLVRKDI